MIVEKERWEGNYDIITIQSSKLYNIAALAARCRGLEGVHDTKIPTDKKESNQDIAIETNGDSWSLQYILKWAILKNNAKKHTWTFNVDMIKGKVLFERESGDELPTWMKCATKS